MKSLSTFILILFFVFPSLGQNQGDIDNYVNIIRKLKQEKDNLEDDNESLLRKLESLTSNRKSLEEVKAEMEQEEAEKSSRSTEDVLLELTEREAELESLIEAKKQVEESERSARRKSRELSTKLTKEEKENKKNQELLMEAKLKDVERQRFLYGLGAITLFILLLASIFYMRFRSNRKQKNALQETNKVIEEEKKRSDDLLLNILPAPIATELKQSGKAAAQKYENVTVLFTDFKDFTKVSERLTPEQLVRELDYCFRGFDFIISQYGVEKIKTIGDAYMCATGLSNKKTMPINIIKAALEMQEFLEDYKKERMIKSLPFFEARIGIHTGPVVAGVVGVKKFAYDIWGDTVNIAARMEANAGVGKVNISEETYRQVKYNFDCEHRGKINAKNKGYIDMYHVKQPVANVVGSV